MTNQSSLSAWQDLRVPLAIYDLIGTLTHPIAKSQYFHHISKIMEQEATLDITSKKGCRVRQSFVKPPTQLGLANNPASSLLLPDWEKVIFILNSIWIFLQITIIDRILLFYFYKTILIQKRKSFMLTR